MAYEVVYDVILVILGLVLICLELRRFMKANDAVVSSIKSVENSQAAAANISSASSSNVPPPSTDMAQQTISQEPQT